MQTVLLLSRLIHILSAIFRVGTTLFMVGFLEPAIRASDPGGGKTMGRLISGTRFSLAIALAGWATILSGVLMYAWNTDLNLQVMFQSRLLLTIGALAGILAGIVGMVVQGRASGKLARIIKSIAAGDTQTTPEILGQIGGLHSRIQRGSRISRVLMISAVIGIVL